MASALAEDPPNQFTSLLPSNQTPHSLTPPKNHRTTLRAFILSITIGAIIGAASVFALFSAYSSENPVGRWILKGRRHPHKLKKPVVILISSDGFRFGYQFKTPTPNIDSLIFEGTEADRGLIPVFPTMTFPNHYSIATGLHPAYHGIVNNDFVDPVTGEKFLKSSVDPKWWLGEPMWVTAANNGLQVATYYWPGSEVKKGKWTCPPKFCKHFNASNLDPFEERVKTILGYLDSPNKDEIPSLIHLYLQDPDSQGHKYGPDDPRITKAIAHVDSTIGLLIEGLKKRGIYEKVHIILLGDHGMVGTCDSKLIFMDDFAPEVTIPASWIQTYTPLLTIRPPANVSSADIAAKMNNALKSNKVRNGEYLKIYLKEELPDRFVYKDNDRITPIVGLVAEGFKLKQNDTKKQECGGTHGYDNAYFSMRSIFIGHGPMFKRGCKFPSFINVEIYNLVTSILKIPGAPNNGTSMFAKSFFSCRFRN
ncbi:hypothetical protein Scep_007703 [Stephania cephalantha]|uniref:Uncharacterized protein n=1 Tax=Stephania cephalantha TaxID=152367 RepID=A0AAP0PQA5_9MAGN